jgi:hypothetical protein
LTFCVSPVSTLHRLTAVKEQRQKKSSRKNLQPCTEPEIFRTHKGQMSLRRMKESPLWLRRRSRWDVRWLFWMAFVSTALLLATSTSLLWNLDSYVLLFDGHRMVGSSPTRDSRVESNHKTMQQLHLPQSLLSSSPSPPLLALVVGLPKSGTTTVYELFHCSGFQTSHYCCCGSFQTEYPCTNPATSQIFGHAPNQIMSVKMHSNLQEGRSILSNLGEYSIHAQLDGELLFGQEEDVEGGNGKGGKWSYFLPQHYHLEKLHQAAPNATWILNLRPPEDWARSVLGWLDLAQRLWETDLYYRTTLQHQDDTNNNINQSPFHQNDSRAKRSHNEIMTFLVEFYNHHTETVRQFVQSRPSQVLIEVDITRPEEGKALLVQAFPGVRPDCWSRHNAGPFFSTL